MSCRLILLVAAVIVIGTRAYAVRFEEFDPAVGADEWSITVERTADFQQRRQKADATLQLFKTAWRDGRLKEAQRMLPLMAEAGVRGRSLGVEADELLRRGEPELARHILEHFPDARLYDHEALFRQWRDAGARVTQEQWLPQMSQKSDYWLHVHSARLGGQPDELRDLLASLERSFKEDPANATKARKLVIAARASRQQGYDWIADVFRSPNASDHLVMATAVRPIASGATEIRLLERGLSLKPTDSDRIWVERRRTMIAAMPHRIPPFEDELRTSLQVALLDAFKRNGRAAEAQQLMEALMQENDGQLPHNLQYAGQIQAMSGARVVESKVLDAEQERGDTPEYWRGRGTYYVGRKEWKLAEEAFLKSLELAAPEGSPASLTRSGALHNYITFLQRVDAKRAYEEFWQYAEGLPAERVLSLAGSFDGDSRMTIVWDDERCWNLLADSERWESDAERLLRKMLSDIPREQWIEGLQRAARLARDADGTRSFTLARVMRRTNPGRNAEPLEALSLLEYAVARNAADQQGTHERKQGHDQMRRALYAEHLAREDWQKALKVYPVEGRELAEPAIVAARAGDLVEAMDMWKQVVAAERMYIEPLRILKDTPLRDDLVRYYRAMASREPENAVPARALKLLEGSSR